MESPVKPESVVTTAIPQSPLSGADIAQPYESLARGLGELGQGAEQVAEPLAQKAAADELSKQKVTRDADGNVQVVNPAGGALIFGRAGELYADAVRAGTVAQHQNVLSETLNDFHQQNPANPQGFMAASEKYREKYLAQFGGGIGGAALMREFDQLQTQHYNAITDSAAQTDLAKTKSSISAAMESARDDAMTMARAGVKLDDPAMRSKVDQYFAAISRRQSNPLFGYSAEQADLDRKGFTSEIQASNFLHHVDEVYSSTGDGGGYAGAMKAADDILTNRGYALSTEARETYWHKAVAEVRANEAMRRQDVSEARAAFNELSMVSASGGAVSSDDVERIATAARSAGDPGLAARVYSSFIRKPLNDTFGQQPLAEQTKQLMALHGASAASFVNSALIAKGYSPIAAAGVVGNLVHESGVDSTAVGDNGTSAGIAQFHADRLAALKAFAAERGKPATDLQTQVDFIDRELHTTEAGTLAKLQAAKTPEEAAAAFIDYERPQGWTPQNPAGGLGYESRKALARQVFTGQPADMSMGPAGSSWLEANRQRTVAAGAYAEWQAIMKDYRERGARPSVQTVNDIVSAARAARNSDLLDTIAHDSDQMNLAGQSSRSPLAVQQSHITDLNAAGTAGVLPPGSSAVITDLQRRYNAINNGLNENPIATTVANFPDLVKDPGPLNFSSESSLISGLGDRMRIALFAEQNWQTRPLSILDKSDLQQMQTTLQSQAGPAVLRALASAGLRPEQMNVLLDKPEIRDSITGMSRSGDPVKMDAAFNFMDQLQKQNPQLFDQQFKDGLKDLRAWQSVRAFYTPEVTAKKIEAASMPQAVELRKASDTTANEFLSKLSAANVVSKFSTGWGPFGTTANMPAGDFAAAAGALKADYDTNFKEEFAITGDPGTADRYAMDKLRNKYAVSPTSGNRIMAYAPENPNYYPMINGSYDWMAKQLDQDLGFATGGKLFEGERVSPKQGPRYANASTDAGAVASRQYQAPRALVSDNITEGEIGRRLPPSYQVVLQDPATGRWGVLMDAEGKPRRIRFDPSALIADRAARAEAARSVLVSPANSTMAIPF